MAERSFAVRIVRAMLLSAAVLVTGCSETVEPSFYLLDAGTQPPQASSARSAIGLREIGLPLYARRPQIASRGANGAVSVSDLHRWAEEPPRAATRLIARRLSSATGTPVVVEPWSAGIEPDAIVSIEVDYLIGGLGTELQLSGQYQARRRSGEANTVTHQFDIRETVAGPTYRALVASHGLALQALADQIAAGLKARP